MITIKIIIWYLKLNLNFVILRKFCLFDIISTIKTPKITKTIKVTIYINAFILKALINCPLIRNTEALLIPQPGQGMPVAFLKRQVFLKIWFAEFNKIKI